MTPAEDTSPRSQIEAATTRRVTIEGRLLRVCDGLFDAATIARVDQLARGCHYTFDNADSPDDAAFNRRWRAEFDLEFCSRHAFFFQRVLELLNEDGRARALGLDRVYANVNAFGERFYPHTDGETGRAGLTALYYANARWEPGWGAPTIFYESGEPAYLVTPRPGRLLVFDAAITHCGAPPERVSPEPRWSIAFKMSERDA